MFLPQFIADQPPRDPSSSCYLDTFSLLCHRRRNRKRDPELEKAVRDSKQYLKYVSVIKGNSLGFMKFFFHQLIFDDGTTDSSSSEDDSPTTIPETEETPRGIENETNKADEAAHEEGREEDEDLDCSETTEEPDEESQGQEEENNDERDVVGRYAPGGDYWVYYGLSMYDPPSAWEEREREWKEQNNKPL